MHVVSLSMHVVPHGVCMLSLMEYTCCPLWSMHVVPHGVCMEYAFFARKYWIKSQHLTRQTNLTTLQQMYAFHYKMSGSTVHTQTTFLS